MAVMAINTRLVIPGKLDGIGWFTLETVQRITADHPEHQFHLLFDRRPPLALFPTSNVQCHWLLPPARRPFLQDLWFDHAVARFLKRNDVDLFISPDGFHSARSSVPQLVVQHDLNFEHHPEWLPQRVARHYLSRFPMAAEKAIRMATVSTFSAEDIHKRYGIPRNRIDVVYNGAGLAYRQVPLGLDALSRKAAVRNKFTKGQPYFVFIGTQHPRKNVEGLLAAFRQYREDGGQWDLLLVGTALWRKRRFDSRRAVADLPQSLSSHVHQSDWLPQSELAQVLSAAGGLVFIPWFEGFGIPIVEAFAAGTPVIHSNRTSVPEVAGDAGIEVDPGDEQAVARAMRRLEREPALGKALVEKGKVRAELFTWSRTAQLLWDSISKAAAELGLDWDSEESGNA